MRGQDETGSSGGDAATFDPRRYWQSRLSSNLSIHGVGYFGYGLPFNTWMYRVRKRVFKRVLHDLPLGVSGATVLDIGAGTGFYVNLWRSAGAKSVTAFDLTSVATEHIRGKFPGVEAVEVDISHPLSAQYDSTSKFDIVSVFDVLFHIVDDAGFEQAIANIAELLVPGGYLLLSDNFVHGTERRTLHQVSRPLDRICDLLRASGFIIERRVPMFVLMNAPIDTNSGWYMSAWRYMMGPVRLWHWLGHLQGALMYPLEIMLTKTLSESPTTELLVCKKVSG
jgi:SAM-dependent methyltransferase